MAINGTASSWTSQATMPFGLTTRSIVTALASPAARAGARQETDRESGFGKLHGSRFSCQERFVVRRGDEIAGHRAAGGRDICAATSTIWSAVTASIVGRPVLDVLHRLAGGKRGAEDPGERGVVVLGVDGAGGDPVLGAGQFVLADAVRDQIGQDAVDIGHQVVETDHRRAARRRGRNGCRRANSTDSRRRRRSRRPCRRPAGDRACWWCRRRGCRRGDRAPRPRRARRSHRTARDRSRCTVGWVTSRIGERHRARGQRLGLARPHPRRRLGAARQLAVGRLGELADFVLGDVAGDDDDGVVGRVVAIVEGDGVIAVELRHFDRPADGRECRNGCSGKAPRRPLR